MRRITTKEVMSQLTVTKNDIDSLMRQVERLEEELRTLRMAMEGFRDSEAQRRGVAAFQVLDMGRVR